MPLQLYTLIGTGPDMDSLDPRLGWAVISGETIVHAHLSALRAMPVPVVFGLCFKVHRPCQSIGVDANRNPSKALVYHNYKIMIDKTCCLS